jgi:hypothetical protein
MPDKIEGYLEVGINGNGEVVINSDADTKLDEEGRCHWVFSTAQARQLGWLLIKNATRIEQHETSSPKVSNFDVLKMMGARNMNIQLAPLSNLVRARAVKAGTQVTIGVCGNVVGDILKHKYIGGLILADKEQFDAVKSELEDGDRDGDKGDGGEG